jgi:ribonuclease Z
MSIAFQVLGNAGGDNALFVQIDSGHAVERLLFDCGEGCLSSLPFGELQAIDHLFFSHLHMDHVAGFDTFFRANFDRDTKSNQIWGPPETAAILQHRFQGYLWNLHAQMSASWRIADIHRNDIRTTRLELGEAFAVARDEGTQPRSRVICGGLGFTVESVTMDHRTPTLAYIVREKTRWNVDSTRLKALGLHPGPWLKQFKESTARDEETIVIDGIAHSLGALR